MFNMRIISFLVISILMMKIIAQNKICEEDGGDLEVRAALRIGKYTVVITKANKVWRIENFEFKDKKFSFGQMDDISTHWKYAPFIKYAFPFKYTDKFTGEVTTRVIQIREEKSEEIWQLFSHCIYFDPDLTKPLKENTFSLRIHKFKPGPFGDPLYLMTMFAKFPEEDIDTNIKTVLSFPLNELDLIHRFFVYYLETPSKRQQIKEGKSGTKYKRHIIKQMMVQYQNDTETDWTHDLQSGKCIEDYFVVNAAFPLNDYSRSGDKYSFEILEFSTKHYFVRKVVFTNASVEQKLDVLKVGSIGSIFGCATNVSDIPPGYHPKGSRLKRRKSHSVAYILLGLCIFCAAIVGIGAYIIYKKNQQRHRSQSNPQN